MVARGMTNQKMTIKGLSLLLLVIMLPVAVATVVAWSLGGPSYGFAPVAGITLTATYYYLYFFCARLIRDKDLPLAAVIMMVTYLLRLTAVAAGLYVFLMFLGISPMITVTSFILSHAAILLRSGGALELVGRQSDGRGKERQQSA